MTNLISKHDFGFCLTQRLKPFINLLGHGPFRHPGSGLDVELHLVIGQSPSWTQGGHQHGPGSESMLVFYISSVNKTIFCCTPWWLWRLWLSCWPEMIFIPSKC